MKMMKKRAIQNQWQTNFHIMIIPKQRKEIEKLVDDQIQKSNDLLMHYEAEQMPVAGSVLDAMSMLKKTQAGQQQKDSIIRSGKIHAHLEQLHKFRGSMPIEIFSESSEYSEVRSAVDDFCKKAEFDLMLVEATELEGNQYTYLSWPSKNYKYRLKWDVQDSVLLVGSMNVHSPDSSFTDASNFKYVYLKTPSRTDIFQIVVDGYVNFVPVYAYRNTVQIVKDLVI